MVSKVRNFWFCVFSGVVATTLIIKQIYLKVSVIDNTSTLNHSPQTSLVGSLEEGTLVNMFLLAKHRGSYSSLLITSRNTVPFVLHAARYLLNSLRF